MGKDFNKWFNAFILAGMSVALIVITSLKFSASSPEGRVLLVVSAFGALMGVLATVCSANGRIVTFLFGFLDVAIYGVMCLLNWKDGGSGLGNAILHFVYFVPMQFVGYAQWRRRGAAPSGGGTLLARRLSARQWALYSVIFIVGAVAAYLLVARFDRSASGAGTLRVAALLDVLPLMCNILGQLLMSTAYMEQWIFWIGVNVFSIVMWSCSAADSGFAAVYIVKYSFYLLNSFNGLRIWRALSRRREDEGSLDM